MGDDLAQTLSANVCGQRLRQNNTYGWACHRRLWRLVHTHNQISLFSRSFCCQMRLFSSICGGCASTSSLIQFQIVSPALSFSILPIECQQPVSRCCRGALLAMLALIFYGLFTCNTGFIEAACAILAEQSRAEKAPIFWQLRKKSPGTALEHSGWFVPLHTAFASLSGRIPQRPAVCSVA